MSKGKTIVSRDIGLEIASICSQYFLKSPHLHYGYWPGNLKVDIDNLRTAQEHYAKFLVSHIPDGIKRILDVGCGSGQIARMLVEMGYQVDCVSPSTYLSKQARQLLGGNSRIFECLYEELQTDNRYDLILFSESFQYIRPEEAIKKTFSLLNEGGYILICDFFKRDTPGSSPLPGGHPLSKFYDVVSGYPLDLVKDLDITEQTAPTLDLVNDMLNEVVKPTVELGQQLLDDRLPVVSKCLRFLYRKKINRINKKYFSGVKTAENFKKFKSYRLLLYRKRPLANVEQVDFTAPFTGTTELKSGKKAKIPAVAALARARWVDGVLHLLSRTRVLALISAFAIVIFENIADKEKPHELLSLKDGISTKAIIGLVLVMAGALIRFWAQGHFKKGHILTTGPYSVVRHPLYLGSLLVMCGLLFQLNDWKNWLIILPIFTTFYGAAIISEERQLLQKFGQQWQSYKANTPAIIPSLRLRSFPKQVCAWRWKVYLSTGENIITLVLLSLPFWIEIIIEDFVFEGILGM